MSDYATSHGWTPHVHNPFSDGSYCRVMLARYACPYSKEEHDPTLPPVDVDVFGYRRTDRPAPSGEAAEPTPKAAADREATPCPQGWHDVSECGPHDEQEATP